MCEPQQDVHDGTLGVDDESHDGGEPERDGALPVQDDGDALVLDGGDGVPEQVHDDGEAQVPDHDDVLLEPVHDDELVHDAQDVVRALLLLVLLDDVRHREQVLPHDVLHLCSLVLPMHVHHDYCLLALTYAVELHHYANAVRKLTLT